ncbi:MAG TPA: site-2 protease family protein [Lacipirellula sp.]
MGWSWRIGRLAGIDVYVHFTFILLLVWIGFYHYSAHEDWGEAIRGVLVIVALFAIVVAHELGHALAARRYNIETSDITLLPIGGVARLQRMPEKPSQELVVALAGPAVNVILAMALGIGLYFNRDVMEVSEAARVGGNFLAQLLMINVVLAVFNLLPAFPMDGGRVVRALLAMRMDYVRATQVAATLGQWMAILFGLVGFFGIPGVMGANPFLIFIALFVWMGAAQEANMVQMRSALAGIPVSRAMISQFAVLHPGDPISRAGEYILAGFPQDFPVLDGRELVGLVLRKDLAAAAAVHNPGARVRDIMQTEFVTTSPRDMLYTALNRLQECNCRTLPVVENGNLVGLITADNLAEVLMIQESLRQGGRRRPEASNAPAYEAGSRAPRPGSASGA